MLVGYPYNDDESNPDIEPEISLSMLDELNGQSNQESESKEPEF